MRRIMWWLREPFFYIFWYLPGYLLCLAAFRILNRTKVIGRQNLPDSKGMLLMSNHLSSLDSWFIGHVFFPRPLWFPAKSELFENRIMAVILACWRAFPVRRGKRDKEGMKRILKMARRFIVCLHPTGTRSRDGKIGKGKPGAGKIARDAEAPVIPVYIEGMDEVMPVGAGFPRFGKKLKIRLGRPVDLTPYRKMTDSKETSLLIIEHIINEILKLQKES